LLYGTAMMTGIVLWVSPPLWNVGALITGFVLHPLKSAIGLALNVFGIPLDRWGMGGDDTENKVYTIFCGTFILIYAVLLIAG
jgi:hypothetical protein